MNSVVPDRSPYPGPRPFEAGEQPLFFGREREIADLTSLVTAYKVVLIYAESGAGKTSLLNAGLIPSLVERGFRVFPSARVRGLIPRDINPAEISNVYAFNAMMSWREDTVDPRSLLMLPVDGFLGNCDHLVDGQGLPVASVVVFDQFEEIFAFYPERWTDREPFFRQIAAALAADPLLRVVFVMREDYLASLDPFVHLMPGRIGTRYRLERLRLDAACAAVEGPLKTTTRSFAPGVALNFVRQLLSVRAESTAGTVDVPGEFVEPVQLQIACQSLWNGLPAGVSVITSEHLGEFGDVHDALRNFYERTLKDAAEESGVAEDDLRVWFDRCLITPAGTRGTVYRGAQSTEGIPNAAVDLLENHHLIRAELRAGARWYELTHDRFIGPIQASNEAWRQGLNVTRVQRQMRFQLRRFRLALLVIAAAAFAVVAFTRLQSRRERAIVAWERQLEAINDQLLVDPERSVCLAVKAAEPKVSAERAPRIAYALRRALHESRVRTVFGGKGARVYTAGFSREYALSVIRGADGTVRLWRAGARTDTSVLRADQGAITIAALSSDGRTLVTAGIGPAALVWDTNTGTSIGELRGPAGEISSVAFSRDGVVIVTAGADGVWFWDARTLRTVGNVSANHGHSADRVIFSPDRKSVLTVNWNAPALVWQIASGRSAPLGGAEARFTAAAFSPDGRRIVTVSKDGTAARIWDAVAGRPLLALSGHTDVISDVSFSPDGSRIVSASADGTARVWDAGSGATLSQLQGHRGGVLSASFSTDGTAIVTSSLDGTARTWAAATGAAIAVLRGHEQAVNGAMFNDDGSRVVTFSEDGTARIWDVTEGLERPLLPPSPRHTGLRREGAVNSIAFSTDGTRIVTAGEEGVTLVWDVKKGVPIATFPGHESVSMAEIAADGRRIVTTSTDGVAQLWNIADPKRQPLTLAADPGVAAAVFSPDSRRVVTVAPAASPQMWDVATGHLVKEFPHLSSGENQSVAFSPDGKWIVTAGMDNAAKVWPVNEDTSVATLPGEDGVVKQAAFSPDGRYILTTSLTTSRMWDVTNFGRWRALEGHKSTVTSAAFDAGSRRVATGSIDQTTYVWRIDGTTDPIELRGHSEVRWVGFPKLADAGDSADSDSFVLTVGQDGTATVWDAIVGKPFMEFGAPRGVVTAAAFSPHGTHVAVGFKDGTVMIHRCEGCASLDELVRLAKTRLVTDATCDSK